ncbi:MAG: hypothetical protein ACREOO_20565 [bacterium]
MNKRAIRAIMFSSLIFFAPSFRLLAQPDTEEKPTVVVFEFGSDILMQNEARTLSDWFRAELRNTKVFAVVEREIIEEALTELGLRPSDCMLTACARRVGLMLKAQDIIIGQIGKIGKTYTILLECREVETGAIKNSFNRSHKGQLDEFLPALKVAAYVIAGMPLPGNTKLGPGPLSGNHVRYHVGGNYLIGFTSIDNYMPIGIRLLYHLNLKTTLGFSFGKVVDYGYEYVEKADGSSVILEFHDMTFAELSLDYFLSTKAPISKFVGLSLAYSNPTRVDHTYTAVPPYDWYDSIYTFKKKDKLGIHPQVGVYLLRNFPIASRLAAGYVIFPSEPEGITHSGLTLEAALLLSF